MLPLCLLATSQAKKQSDKLSVLLQQQRENHVAVYRWKGFNRIQEIQ